MDRITTPRLTVAELRQILRFDRDRNALFWLARPNIPAWNAKFAGRRAFTSKNKAGYFTGQINGHCYYAHRVIWAIATGKWPENQIDHKDRDRSHNALENLREATVLQNATNKTIHKNNTSGMSGIYWKKDKRRWLAQITRNGTTYHLGYFVERSEAEIARTLACSKNGF